MDADIAGGLFVKGFVLSAAQFKDFDAACTKGNAVNVVRGLGWVIHSFSHLCVGVCVRTWVRAPWMYA